MSPTYWPDADTRARARAVTELASAARPATPRASARHALRYGHIHGHASRQDSAVAIARRRGETGSAALPPTRGPPPPGARDNNTRSLLPPALTPTAPP